MKGSIIYTYNDSEYGKNDGLAAMVTILKYFAACEKFLFFIFIKKIAISCGYASKQLCLKKVTSF